MALLRQPEAIPSVEAELNVAPAQPVEFSTRRKISIPSRFQESILDPPLRSVVPRKRKVSDDDSQQVSVENNQAPSEVIHSLIRCAVCKAHRRGGCGTERAVARCIRHPNLRTTTNPLPSFQPNSTSSESQPVSPTLLAPVKRQRLKSRCDVCKVLKKGGCGTNEASARCLWRPKLENEMQNDQSIHVASKVQSNRPAPPTTISQLPSMRYTSVRIASRAAKQGKQPGHVGKDSSANISMPMTETTSKRLQSTKTSYLQDQPHKLLETMQYAQPSDNPLPRTVGNCTGPSQIGLNLQDRSSVKPSTKKRSRYPCAVCAIRKKGKCGTPQAIVKCLRLAGQDLPSETRTQIHPPKIKSAPSTPPVHASSPTSHSKSKSGYRACEVCAVRKKGNCGTSRAINQCLNRADKKCFSPLGLPQVNLEVGPPLKRCAVCTSWKKGGCGTPDAISKCLNIAAAQGGSRSPSLGLNSAPGSSSSWDQTRPVLSFSTLTTGAPPPPPPPQLGPKPRAPDSRAKPKSSLPVTSKRCQWCVSRHKAHCGTHQATPGCFRRPTGHSAASRLYSDPTASPSSPPGCDLRSKPSSLMGSRRVKARQQVGMGPLRMNCTYTVNDADANLVTTKAAGCLVGRRVERWSYATSSWQEGTLVGYSLKRLCYHMRREDGVVEDVTLPSPCMRISLAELSPLFPPSTASRASCKEEEEEEEDHTAVADKAKYRNQRLTELASRVWALARALPRGKISTMTALHDALTSAMSVGKISEILVWMYTQTGLRRVVSSFFRSSVASSWLETCVELSRFDYVDHEDVHTIVTPTLDWESDPLVALAELAVENASGDNGLEPAEFDKLRSSKGLAALLGIGSVLFACDANTSGAFSALITEKLESLVSSLEDGVEKQFLTRTVPPVGKQKLDRVKSAPGLITDGPVRPNENGLLSSSKTKARSWNTLAAFVNEDATPNNATKLDLHSISCDKLDSAMC